MKDTQRGELREELDDLRLFADPFEEFRESARPAGGWTASFVRRGEEIALRREPDGVIDTLRGPGQPRYRSFPGLLASETFANVARLAAAQRHLTRDLADPQTGSERDFLPCNVEVEERGAGPSVLKFDGVREALSQSVDGLRVFVVNGVAGVGKSHLIERIVRERAAPDSYRSEQALLLHVESRGKVLTSLDDRIAGTLSSLRAGFVEEELKPLVRRGVIQIAIDGFDELSDSRGYDNAWGVLRGFLRDLRNRGTCVLAGRDTMLDAEAVRDGLQHSVDDDAVTILNLRHPSADEVHRWLSERDKWRGKHEALSVVKARSADSEYLRRPYFVSEIARLDPEEVEGAQGEPIGDLMDNIVGREGPKLPGEASGIRPDVASELYRRVLAEAARLMMDDETHVIDVEILGLIVEEVFSGHAHQEMIHAVAQRAGALALLEESAGDRSKRSFPHETVRSWFFAQSLCDEFPAHGPTVGLHRVPLSAEDFRIFNRVARRRSDDDQAKLRGALRARLVRANGYDYLRANIGGLLLAVAPLEEDAGSGDEPLVLANLELSDVWMADLLGRQQVALHGCTVHRLDVRGADLADVRFTNVRVGELIVDPYVRFGSSAPVVLGSLIVIERLREERWTGPPDEWIRPRMQASAPSGASDADSRAVLELLERFARISMRQYAIRSGKDNTDRAARRILDSPVWPQLCDILRRHKRLETPEGLNAAGPKSEWFHLVRGAEFVAPTAGRQPDTNTILDELGAGA